MYVRNLSESDLEAAYRLVHSLNAYKGKYSVILPLINLKKTLELKCTIRGAFSDSAALVGFYSLIKQPPELDLMFVDDNIQRTGIGKFLFEDLIKNCHLIGLKKIKIVSHPPSEGFYLKMGARKIGIDLASEDIPWERPILELEIINEFSKPK